MKDSQMILKHYSGDTLYNVFEFTFMQIKDNKNGFKGFTLLQIYSSRKISKTNGEELLWNILVEDEKEKIQG